MSHVETQGREMQEVTELYRPRVLGWGLCPACARQRASGGLEKAGGRGRVTWPPVRDGAGPRLVGQGETRAQPGPWWWGWGGGGDSKG